MAIVISYQNLLSFKPYLRGLNDAHLFFHSSKDHKTKISFIGMKSKCKQGYAVSPWSFRDMFLPCPYSGGCRHSLACGGISLISNSSIFKSLSALPSGWLLLCISLSRPLIRTYLIALRAHLNNPGWSDCKMLYLIIARTLFTNQVPFSNFIYWGIFWGETAQSIAYVFVTSYKVAYFPHI